MRRKCADIRLRCHSFSLSSKSVSTRIPNGGCHSIVYSFFSATIRCNCSCLRRGFKSAGGTCRPPWWGLPFSPTCQPRIHVADNARHTPTLLLTSAFVYCLSIGVSMCAYVVVMFTAPAAPPHVRPLRGQQFGS